MESLGTILSLVGLIIIIWGIVRAFKRKKLKEQWKILIPGLIILIAGGIVMPTKAEPVSSEKVQPDKKEVVQKEKAVPKSETEKKEEKETKTEKVATNETDQKKDSKSEEQKLNQTSSINKSETVNNEEDKKTSSETNTSNDVGKEALLALESNDFIKFTNEYKKLKENKTAVWDNQLYGKKVTWTGTVVRAGTSELFVYGGEDYHGESWNDLGDTNRLYTSFVAKYASGTKDEFKKLNTGDKITVKGDLESRGDYDLGYHWKIYNAVIIKK
ncbi:hypothetical protein HYI36_13065 [Bacillus sp. Gen3]|nr:hypothetical protein [Bacillus sp. Gen3]